MSELYKQQREIQSSDRSDEEKNKLVREIQKQINELAKGGLANYNDVSIEGKYATVGDTQYRWYEPSADSEEEPSWKKLTDDQIAKQNKVTEALGISNAKYWSNPSEYNFAYDYPKKYEILKENNVKYEQYINGSDDFKEAYTWASNNPEKYKVSKVITDDVVEYRKHARYIANLTADKDKNGNTISGSKQKKVVAYINGLDLDAGAKYILYKMTYSSSNDYNAQIVKYLDGRDDISYDEMVEILAALGMSK
jgi:hypothetical protein